MAKARAIVKRRKAVQNIRKITRTMQLIATARYQQAYNRAVATRPYTEKITELVSHVSGTAEAVDNPLLREEAVAQRRAVVVLTSNRGLCGGYNAGILRTALAHIDKLGEDGCEVDLHVVGKKGIGYFRFLGRDPVAAITHISDQPRFADVEKIAEGLMRQFEGEQLDGVDVVYMRFISVGRQYPEVLQLLPLQHGPAEDEEPGGTRATVQYEFTPEPVGLLASLLPQTVKVQLFQCFNDATVSEQIARMVAMKSATEAAGDMIKLLSRQYNRARQSQITMELLDIMGGAEALK